MKTRFILGAAFAALIGITLLPAAANAQDINQRRAWQHHRIEQGIKSGQLTHGERRHLHAREASINAREARDRAIHHGRLTMGERHRLNHSLNRTSHAIWRDKHNGAKP